MTCSHRLALLIGCSISTLALSTGPATAAPTAAELQRVIQQQQQQLEAQQKLLEQLQQQVQQLQQQTEATEKKATEAGKQAEAASQAVTGKPLVTSGQSKVKLAISGWVNRMVNVADDGRRTKAYFVDNDLSVSRLRLNGSAQVTGDLKIGANIEIGISPNNSNDVSQLNENPGDKFDQRKVEAVFASKTYGTVFFGKGDPSTKDIARIDLSGTDLLSYANVADVAGGLLFAQKGDGYGNIQVKNVFTDFDNPRATRIRYDTPERAGFTLSGTYGEDQTASGAVRWAGEGHGLKIASGVGITDPSQQGVNYDVVGSASVLHLATGLNLTGAAGVQDQDSQNQTFYYIKGGWQHGFFDFGRTAFSLDYQQTNERPNPGDTGHSVGFVVDQSVADIGTDLYAGLRWYSLDGASPRTDDIYVMTMGTRVKF